MKTRGKDDGSGGSLFVVDFTFKGVNHAADHGCLLATQGTSIDDKMGFGKWVSGNGDHFRICAIAKAHRSLLVFGVAANKAISKADVIKIPATSGGRPGQTVQKILAAGSKMVSVGVESATQMFLEEVTVSPKIGWGEKDFQPLPTSFCLVEGEGM